MDKEKDQERKRKLRLVEKYDNDDYSRFSVPSTEDPFESDDNVHYLNRGFHDREILADSGISGGNEQSGKARGYSGIGPKGYKRSDERIYEDVCESLMRHRAIDASDIAVKVTKGMVNLTGKVDSRPARQLVEKVALNIPGVTEVKNELSVIKGDIKKSGPEGVTKKDLGIT